MQVSLNVLRCICASAGPAPLRCKNSEDTLRATLLHVYTPADRSVAAFHNVSAYRAAVGHEPLDDPAPYALHDRLLIFLAAVSLSSATAGCHALVLLQHVL